jgi:hypothetical protein
MARTLVTWKPRLRRISRARAALASPPCCFLLCRLAETVAPWMSWRCNLLTAFSASCKMMGGGGKQIEQDASLHSQREAPHE